MSKITNIQIISLSYNIYKYRKFYIDADEVFSITNISSGLNLRFRFNPKSRYCEIISPISYMTHSLSVHYYSLQKEIDYKLKGFLENI